MKLEYKDFESIEVIDAYNFPPENKYEEEYHLTIHKDGRILKNDDGHEIELTASREDVEQLYYEVEKFLENVINVEMLFDDCDHKVIINYKNEKVEISQYAFDKNNKYIFELVDEFVDNKFQGNYTKDYLS